MKTFTKAMLVPGKHVVELRNGERYIVFEYKGNKFIMSNKDCFSYFDRCFDDEMRYSEAFVQNRRDYDVMKVFGLRSCCSFENIVFNENEYLTEIWHREEIFITPDEKAILRNIRGFYYIARDKDKKLFVYEKKPVKGCVKWSFKSYEFESMRAFCDLFDMVQWSDDKPWKIEDLLNLPEKEEQNEN